MSAAKKGSKIRIENTRHDDKRTNIPTEELRDFMSDEAQSVEKLLYPRDPSLDPQLVWSGKDEQDQTDLAVDAPPIYIQEKIHPQAIIEDIRAQARNESESQADLFSDFNGIEFEDLIDFYKHEQSWANRMILGDSLQVMGSLAEKEGLRGKVQCIYIDPPYGIRFGSNWQVSTRKRDVKDSKVEDATREPEQVKAFRDTWRDGIHSYLTYLRDRLTIARDLLTESGSIFVQIGDENVHRVRALLDEVFGEENLCALFTVQKTGGLSQSLVPATSDFLVWYCRNKSSVKFRSLFLEKTRSSVAGYNYVEMPSGVRSSIKAAESAEFDVQAGKIYQPTSVESANPRYEFQFEDKIYNHRWKTHIAGLRRLAAASRFHRTKNSLRYVRFIDDFPVIPITSVWTDTGSGSFLEEQIYVVQTVTKIVQRCLLMTTDPGDLVLDPTCGSGTTAYVAEQWGRRWITVDTSRVALALARTRIMGARYPYYLLSDSREGRYKEAELSRTETFTAPTHGDIRQGFVYERVPHITLKSIANNAEIDVIYEKFQKKLEPLREQLNASVGKVWKEWEIPRNARDDWSDEAKTLHARWWEQRTTRQREINVSIAANADHEYLYDKPYEDKKRLRVSGPFTVESLSPHRVLSTDEAVTGVSENASKNGAETVQDFVSAILDNLKKSGVQNTVKEERLKFDRLESYAGAYIHAEGEYTEQDGTVQRVAVCIGPEHGTVGPQLVKEAAKEAVKGTGFDLLVVCGFAFDPHVSEEAKQYGKLSVLVTKMNPDLAMGDELLKKTGSGNLFMVFGEPDIEIEHQDDGKLAVEINGVDVYDPTTGQIRSNSTDDIACWFIDTNYNDESFFVRHAYFTGAGNPYDKLKKALKAEIDEDTWSSLYSTRSRPFGPPKTGKLAVKVINHYGDEVVKICNL